jgi:hypothetical protein
MAEPTNTPMPASTPVPASTPRSSSPAPPIPSLTPEATTTTTTTTTTIASRPAPSVERPIVLHIGDPIKYNPETYAEFSQAFHVIRPSTRERERCEFIRALKERRWGDFSAIFRPFWGTGGEMGRWDAELIDLLPDSVRVFASAGAGFDWADTKLLGEKGEQSSQSLLKWPACPAPRSSLYGEQASSTATRASRPPKPSPTSPSPWSSPPSGTCLGAWEPQPYPTSPHYPTTRPRTKEHERRSKPATRVPQPQATRCGATCWA